MSHEFEHGMFVREAAWHGLGTVLKGAPSIQDALAIAGLSWSVRKLQLQRPDGTPVNRWVTTRDRFTCARCAGKGYHAVSTTTGILDSAACEACASTGVLGNEDLGYVGADWEPLQNADAFKWFQPILDAGLATLETAGSLRGGARVFMLARIKGKDDVIVPKSDDRVARYILLAHGHDGQLAIRTGITPVRVVCANTLSAAIDGKNLVRIFHTSSAKQTLEAAREVIMRANTAFDRAADCYRALAKVKNVTPKMISDFVDLVFPPAKKPQLSDVDARPEYKGVDGPGLIADLKARKKNEQLVDQLLTSKAEAEAGDDDKRRVTEEIMELIETGAGNDLPGVKGTAWGVYNGMTDYLTHGRGNDDAVRLNAQFFQSQGARAIAAAQQVFLKGGKKQ